MDLQRIEGFASRKYLPVGILVELIFDESAERLEQRRKTSLLYPSMVTRKDRKFFKGYNKLIKWVIGLVHPYPGNKASILDILESSVSTQDWFSWISKNKTNLPMSAGTKIFIEICKKNTFVSDEVHENNLEDKGRHINENKISSARRIVKKLETQARYKDWQKAYPKLKKEKPGKSDVWYSQQIAKMVIAQGRNAATIRKNMKK